MNYNTKAKYFSYTKNECKTFLNKELNNSIRVKVLSSDVERFTGRKPKVYQKLMNRTDFDDHRVFLKIGIKCIGFIVSPYNLHTERHKALELKGHSVFEIRQQHHINAETFAVIQNEYVNCILWKRFDLK